MIAAQVYSVRELASKNFYETMKQVKEIGYEGVELAGLYGHGPGQIRDWLKELNLVPISAHVPYEAFAVDMDATLDAYETIGCSYIAIPYLAMDRLYGGEKFEETENLLHTLAKKCKERGICLLYHNHSHEFVRTDSGTYVFDALYQRFPNEELETEMDTCWIKVGGEDPVAYIKKYENRCPVIHMKDFIKKETVQLVALGEGLMDVKATALTAAACGTKHFVIEQDDHPYGSPLENMEKSFLYLSQCLEQ